MMWFKISAVTLVLVTLVGCQTTTIQKPPQQSEPIKTEPKTIKTPDGIVITPYDRPEIQREQVVIPNQAQVQQKFEDGRQLPAFQHLMQQTQNAFKQGKWNDAEQTAMHAQRLAPQSAETYMYLAMIANHKNQARNAESLARRGLSYAQSTAMKRQLWQIILKSAQSQRDAKTIAEAQSKIKSL